jgi:hypothetical protein
MRTRVWSNGTTKAHLSASSFFIAATSYLPPSHLASTLAGMPSAASSAGNVRIFPICRAIVPYVATRTHATTVGYPVKRNRHTGWGCAVVLHNDTAVA